MQALVLGLMMVMALVIFFFIYKYKKVFIVPMGVLARCCIYSSHRFFSVSDSACMTSFDLSFAF